MKALLSLLATFVLSACTAGSDAVPADTGGTADSTMVVPSEARVPSPESGARGSEGPRVVFLGTSLTAGMGLEGDEAGYVEVLDAMADSLGMPFQAVNAGVSGETSAGGLRRLDWVLREPMDVLVLELGANDGLRGQDPQALRSNLEAIIDGTRTRYPDARIVLAGMEAPPNLGPRYTEAFREVFPQVARDRDAVLVPFLLEGVAGVPKLNQEDRIHPTAEGHRRIARTVWPYLEPLLKAEGPGDDR
ncbi:MAG: arylesterase [Longimicrobiales bacterium]|nr:arylesterase [Longimicrobiales bacterium]